MQVVLKFGHKQLWFVALGAFVIEIERLNPSHVDGVLKIQLAPKQAQFSANPEQFMADGSETQHLFVIKQREVIVGYFKLDTGYSSEQEFCPKEGIGLRGFAIDRKQQGKGLGTQASKLIPEYVKRHYPEFNKVYLSVNCKNPAAKKCYLNSGFSAAGIQVEGPVGPQDIMVLEV